MADLADGGLTPIIGRPVLDRTGLTGHFDLDVTWTPDSRPPGPQAAGVGEATFAALQEQLGLRLAHERGAEERYIIVSAGRPINR
jgi:uncharacterized protein (TIGR03435 family)